MKLILSGLMLVSLAAYSVPGSGLSVVAGSSSNEIFVSDSLLTEADIDEIERRIEALPNYVPVIAEGALAAKDAVPSATRW